MRVIAQCNTHWSLKSKILLMEKFQKTQHLNTHNHFQRTSINEQEIKNVQETGFYKHHLSSERLQNSKEFKNYKSCWNFKSHHYFHWLQFQSHNSCDFMIKIWHNNSLSQDRAKMKTPKQSITWSSLWCWTVRRSAAQAASNRSSSVSSCCMGRVTVDAALAALINPFSPIKWDTLEINWAATLWSFPPPALLTRTDRRCHTKGSNCVNAWLVLWDSSLARRPENIRENKMKFCLFYVLTLTNEKC